jgi:hypothetical protein
VLDVKDHGLYSKTNVFQNAQLDTEKQMENVYLAQNIVDSVLEVDVFNAKKDSKFKMEDA